MDFSFEFNYQINGRKVSKDEWMRHIADEARSKAAAELSARVARLRCPVHNESPKVLRTTKTGDRISFDIQACCKTMLEQAQRVAVGAR
jgi:Ser-tRNA(Ala) deacylase AlaX